MEKHHANSGRELVLDPFEHLPDPRILAVPVHILRMADGTGSPQASPAHEEIRLLSQGFLFEQEPA